MRPASQPVSPTKTMLSLIKLHRHGEFIASNTALLCGWVPAGDRVTGVGFEPCSGLHDQSKRQGGLVMMWLTPLKPSAVRLLGRPPPLGVRDFVCNWAFKMDDEYKYSLAIIFQKCLLYDMLDGCRARLHVHGPEGNNTATQASPMVEEKR
ncbi:hypothetical protein HaLaN_31227 [Haematococcus lacustris]|uniref:Uncharacterized protein n=1 Tax=Haematococcus lacustris TaxID=44745 RepID=A0A6A0AGI8_HAELA|nr:hypothetical protein HaLaN_31227 [Haematococcus lacustris]